MTNKSRLRGGNVGGGIGCIGGILIAFAASSAVVGTVQAAEPAQPALKSVSFDKDPGWQATGNRTTPDAEMVTQNFGYSATSFASKTKGEIGGLAWRALQPAWYAEKIEPKTLDDKLTATGTFALTESGGGGHVFFGWFNSDQHAGTSRAVGALGMEIGTEKSGGRVHIRLHTAQNQSSGMIVQPEGDKKSRGPFRNDGTHYTWKLEYDPQANAGNGRVTFTFHSNLPEPEPFEKKTYSMDIPAGYRKQGTVLDRFGMMNGTKPGGHCTVYFGDLERDGRSLDLARNPEWDGVGNRSQSEKGAGASQDFGFSNSAHAGGQAGEIGGTFCRTGAAWGAYADRVGPLSLDNRLEAQGKVTLQVGAPDSGMLFGWFDSSAKEKAPDEAGNFLGVKVAGPSRAGHYFQPAYTTAKGTARAANKGPLLVPGRASDWSLLYDPAANNGLGSIRVTLGEESSTFDLKKGDKSEGGRFDRFGLFTVHNDGGHGRVIIFFDDLQYTAMGGK